jgi:manganese oxidase
MHRHSWALLLVAGLLGTSPRDPARRTNDSSMGRRGASVARIAVNDNRIAGGTQRGGVLTLRLVARMGMWHPDGDDAPGAPVPAFAEEGGAPRIPGPMIRVRAGTDVVVTLRNALPSATLTVHGLHSRDAGGRTPHDSVRLAPGEARTLRLRLDAPGTYYYWGTTMGRTLEDRTREDAQLTGAIVVDPASGAPPADRVLVIGMWSDTSGRSFMVRKRMLVVVNGLSWPRTERLGYTVGDTVRWRVINASADSHPMHLHGFYFLVDSRGDGSVDDVYATDRRDMAVTDLMKPGATMRMTWSPDRPGNWLFHCHLPQHIGHRGSLGMPAPPAAHGHADANHALAGMSGLVMGVTVRPAAGRAAPPADVGARRALRLVIHARTDGTADDPHFAYTLDDGRAPSASDHGDRAAPPIVLVRGEPVSITVLNTLAEPTAVHWHGIELESYFDGVAGFSGSAGRLSPVIAPGDSFVARFTPPRAGTFIYHTHVDEERQQPAGLAGPLVVLEPGERWDPSTDVTVVVSSPPMVPDANGFIARVALLNGGASAAPLELRAGVRHRLRLINMSTNIPGLRFELTRDGAPVRWRVLAKDGADLPADRRAPRPARQPLSIGETVDVEFTPEQSGDHRITAHLAGGQVVGSLLVHVGTAPPRAP